MCDEGNDLLANLYAHIEHLLRLVKSRPELAKELEPTILFLGDHFDKTAKQTMPAIVNARRVTERNRSNASHHISAKTIINEWDELEIVGKGTKTELAMALGISRTTLNELIKKYELTDRIKKANS